MWVNRVIPCVLCEQAPGRIFQRPSMNRIRFWTRAVTGCSFRSDAVRLVAVNNRSCVLF